MAKFWTGCQTVPFTLVLGKQFWQVQVCCIFKKKVINTNFEMFRKWPPSRILKECIALLFSFKGRTYCGFWYLKYCKKGGRSSRKNFLLLRKKPHFVLIATIQCCDLKATLALCDLSCKKKYVYQHIHIYLLPKSGNSILFAATIFKADLYLWG